MASHLPRILAIDVAPEHLRPYETRSDVMLIVTRYSLLDATLLAQVMPDAVLAPLLGHGFDIIDLVARLESMGYAGPLRALSYPMPDTAAVVAEVRSHCSTVDFNLQLLPEVEGQV